MRTSLLLLPFLFFGCSDPNSGDSADVNSDPIPERPKAGIQLPMIEDNLRHDTLLIHETFDLGDGTFVMSARNNEDTFEGLRLYHYRAMPDSSAEILSYSRPAYDSWMMRPSFFVHPNGGYLILAEFGYLESWGQKVIHLSDSGFKDLGYLDVAVREQVHIAEIDSSYLSRMSVAPFTQIEFIDQVLHITFNSDSVYVYDDLQGHLDTTYMAGSVAYRFNGEKLELQISDPH